VTVTWSLAHSALRLSASFGRAVSDLFGHPDQAGDRADEHELATGNAFSEVGGGSVGQVHGGPQVDVE
jgi:hypothetical protein